MKRIKFYMCHVKDTPKAPMVCHETLAEAQAEAERLCRKEGKPVAVLMSLEYCDIPDRPLLWSGFAEAKPAAKKK